MNDRKEREMPCMVACDVVLLITLVLAINTPYFSRVFIGAHDTLAIFQHFHFVYSEWVFNDQIPRWVPYGTFGSASDFLNLVYLSPMSYLTMVVGKLFRVDNALVLFKSSVLVEQLLFLGGTYLLCHCLFRKRSTVLLVCLAAIGSTVWHSQIGLNWRICYLFPLVLFFVLRFFASHRSEFLWLGGIVGGAWAMGGAYLPVLWAFVFAVILVVLFVHYRGSWRCRYTRSWSNVGVFLGFVVVASTYSYFAWKSTRWLDFQTPGRDPATGRFDIGTFLTYGGRADLVMVLQSALLGWPIHLPWGSKVDNSVYIGMLPLVFFIWGVVKERNPVFLAIVAAVVAVVWLSLGGIFAALVYYVSPLLFFRHIGLTYGLVKILVVLGAGFGWENFWSSSKRTRLMLTIVAGLLFLIDVSVSLPLQLKPEVYSMGRWVAVFTARVFMYGVAIGLVAVLARSLHWRRLAVRRGLDTDWLMRFALVVVLLLDVGSFQCVVFRYAPMVPTKYSTSLDTVRVSKPEFQPQRSWAPLTERQQCALDISTWPGTGAHYVMIYSFAQFDPCKSAFRTDMRSPGVERLLGLRKEDDPSLLKVLGCDNPKIRLARHAIFAETATAAETIVRESSGLDAPVLVARDAAGIVTSHVEEVASEVGDTEVTEFSANSVEIVATVKGEQGAWLVYADAFHPGWHATVNGVERRIEEAYLAFKAVRLDPGRSVVRFEYRNGVMRPLSYAIALFGVVFSLVLLGITAMLCFPIIGPKAWCSGMCDQNG